MEDQKYKVYKVSGDDYSALSFEQKFKGKSVADAVKEVFEKNDKGLYEDEEDSFEVSLAFETSDKDSFFKQREEQDYDDSKHTKLFIEDEILES